LAHAADLAMGSRNESVRCFGALLTSRIPILLSGDVEPYCDSLDDLEAYIDFAKTLGEAGEVDAE